MVRRKGMKSVALATVSTTLVGLAAALTLRPTEAPPSSTQSFSAFDGAIRVMVEFGFEPAGQTTYTVLGMGIAIVILGRLLTGRPG